MAAIEHRAPELGLGRAEMPRGFTIDPTIPAVAVGTGLATTSSLDSLRPERSERFVVAGALAVERSEDVPEAQDGVRYFSDPVIASFQTCIGAGAVGSVPQVAANLGLGNLGARGLDGTNVAIVIMDTGINIAHVNAKRGVPARFDAANSWSPPSGSGPAPFNHPVDHGTMCAFDALIAAPNATLLDYPILATSVPGGALTGSTLRVAFLAFADLLAKWAIAFAAGGPQRYSGLVVNNSWGIYHPSWDFPPGHPGRFIDNPQHPFNQLVASLAGTGADILFAAGNCGAQCPDGRCQGRVAGAIMGTNASADVLTVAGCDIHDQRVGYSSQGPSVANMPQQKPDLTAYTHFLGSEYSCAGDPDTGTSAACPVAAGCVAALRTRLSPATEPPAHLFTRLRSTARPAVGTAPGQWNGDYGWGIIDPDAAAGSAGV
ncbi:MAG: S8 family serine peptidase [Pseudomonadota bacterium]|nr:S8 family serine peptidase [Pseudomonadota bacterium]